MTASDARAAIFLPHSGNLVVTRGGVHQQERLNGPHGYIEPLAFARADDRFRHGARARPAIGLATKHKPATERC